MTDTQAFITGLLVGVVAKMVEQGAVKEVEVTYDADGNYTNQFVVTGLSGNRVVVTVAQENP
jgi:hypothetical protein